eukprot:89734-Hanusia_phi.AAC.4
MPTLQERCWARRREGGGEGSKLLSSSDAVCHVISSLSSQLTRYCTMIIASLPGAARGSSVYTGGAGLAFALARVAATTALLGDMLSLDIKTLMGHAEIALKTCGAGDRRVGSSLLCGVSGNMLVQAMIDANAGRATEANMMAAEYLKFLGEALQNDSDEWLYGRAGYLHGLMLLRRVSSQQHVCSSLPLSLFVVDNVVV